MRNRAAQTFHSTARQAANVALKANAGQLVLGHFSARYIDESVLLTEAKSHFANTFLANEGAVFTPGEQPDYSNCE
jgi:ribonuclease Z